MSAINIFPPNTPDWGGEKNWGTKTPTYTSRRAVTYQAFIQSKSQRKEKQKHKIKVQWISEYIVLSTWLDNHEVRCRKSRTLHRTSHITADTLETKTKEVIVMYVIIWKSWCKKYCKVMECPNINIWTCFSFVELKFCKKISSTNMYLSVVGIQINFQTWDTDQKSY